MHVLLKVMVKTQRNCRDDEHIIQDVSNAIISYLARKRANIVDAMKMGYMYLHARSI